MKAIGEVQIEFNLNKYEQNLLIRSFNTFCIKILRIIRNKYLVSRNIESRVYIQEVISRVCSAELAGPHLGPNDVERPAVAAEQHFSKKF